MLTLLASVGRLDSCSAIKEAEFKSRNHNVRYWPKADIRVGKLLIVAVCPLTTQSGHRKPIQITTTLLEITESICDANLAP